MHASLVVVQERLEEIISRIQSDIPNNEPIGNAHNNWSFPAISKEELIQEAQSIIDFIDKNQTDKLDHNEDLIADYDRRLQHLYNHTVPQLWGNAGQAISAYVMTLRGLHKALSPALAPNKQAELSSKRAELSKKLRSLEASLRKIEPRAASLEEMVTRIESAHTAADQLPLDLETLSEAREEVTGLCKTAQSEMSKIERISQNIDKTNEQHDKRLADADDVLAKCETAYSAATSVGLAAAFNERSKELSKSIRYWVGGLVVALSFGAYFGSSQLFTFLTLISEKEPSAEVIIINFILSMLSVLAPVWFSWLSTKQIGQRFRLSEDYAFKASVARAYEGFRRETARFDEEMGARLLSSALGRLDELPLRLVEADTHGSPFHELANSQAVKEALRTVPGFAGQIRGLAQKSTRTSKKTKDRNNRVTEAADNVEEATEPLAAD